MKAALLAGALVYAALFFFTTFVPSQQARQQALDVGFSEATIERGLRYAFQRSLLYWSATGANLLLLVLLGCTSAGRKLCDGCHAWTGRRWFLTLLAMLALYFLAEAVVSLPFGVLRLELNQAWEMTNRSLEDWLSDWLLGTGVYILVWGVPSVALFILTRLYPRWWWLPATAFITVAGIAFAFLQPLIILPLFNTFTPLAETEWAQEPGIRDLLRKGGVDMDKILIVNASRQGEYTNAYYTGFGPSKRIVLYDTLLKRHEKNPAEIESVLAHEIGHWQHDHIVKGIALAIPGVLLGMFALSRLLLGAVGRRPWHLDGPSDPAAVPLLMLLITAGMWLAMPVITGVSRHFERQADRTALDLAGNPKAFIAAEQRLVETNKSNVATPPWTAWLFGTHPTPAEAIRMAQEWQRSKNP